MLHRRDAMIRLGRIGLGGMTLLWLLAKRHAQAKSTTSADLGGFAPNASAKSCILLYLWGGPPQIDMWDMKPEAPDGIRSLFSPIDTVTPGIQICDQLPLMARHTDKMAIIRSYTHPSNTHEVGVYHTLTGKVNNTLSVPRNQRNRADFPSTGAVVSYFSPPGGTMPASATIPRPIGHDGVTYTGTYAGFLGPQHDPLEMQTPGEVSGPAPHSLDLPQGINAHRMQSRYGLLKVLDDHDRRTQQNSAAVAGLDRFREQAFRMLLSPEAKGAFDLNRESDAIRDLYGRNEYGESFLLARRLVEAGVKLVTVVWYYISPKDGNVLNVWDNHGGTGSIGGITGYEMLKAPYCLPSLDRAYSALLEDLQQRGLLDETLLVMLGEFGRTPQINKMAGRDHWGPCQSVVLAGGGIKGGQVYGASDKIAAWPTKNPVSPEDVIATTYSAMGLSPHSMIHDQQNRPHRICEGTPLTALF